MTIALRLSVYFLCLGVLCTVSFAGGRHALVIGVDRYEYLDEYNQLDVAVEDAQLIARTLEALEPAFEVTLCTNVSQDEAEDALDEFIDAAEGAECALLYFAGHGIEYHGENFLLVSDTEIEKISDDIPRMKRRLGNEALSLQAWVDSLDTTEPGVKVVILDACRDNPLKAVGSSGTRSVVGGKGGLAQVTPPSGSLIAYSADAGQKANDGLFTKILSEKLITPGLPLLEVFASTREEVLKLSTEMEKADNGVRHEPAEYTKLNLAGTRFSFLPVGEKPGTSPGNAKGATEEMVRLRLELEELKRKMSIGGVAPPMETPGQAQSAAYRSLAGKTPGEERGFPGATMIWCPPTGPKGFMMGSAETEKFRRTNEEQRQVILTRGFWLAK